MMRGGNKNDGSIFWYVECASWSDFPEENAYDSSPEEEEEVVEEVWSALWQASRSHCRVINSGEKEVRMQLLGSGS